jgi:hypothetical protein
VTDSLEPFGLLDERHEELTAVGVGAGVGAGQQSDLWLVSDLVNPKWVEKYSLSCFLMNLSSSDYPDQP